ncbi:MAG: 39S ribosomal protein L45 [Candidatus Accumulibacter sp.]|jgi:predicted lipid-binding transport protein (Tim44 family)|nr:39S ribosomal protein L45 [Accumulibacter sp.]
MKKLLMGLFISFAVLGLCADDAEAARFGGGRSFGMRRGVTPRPAPTHQAAPRAPGAPAAAPGAPAKRGWLGPVAGLAAGIGLAALFSHLGLGEELANVAMVMFLVMAAMFVFRALTRRGAPAARPMQYAGTGRGGVAPLPQASDSAGSSAPVDFDAPAFLRVAKLNFVRLQASNDAGNLDDIREFTSPEVFAEIKLQMSERGAATQQTDVVRLDADLLEMVTEGKQHVASVRFHGLIREEANAPAVPFDEVWVLAKPTTGERGWVVAGIKQAG